MRQEAPNFIFIEKEFLEKLEKQFKYYNRLTPFKVKSYFVLGARKAVVHLGKYHEYIGLKKENLSTVEKEISKLKKQAKIMRDRHMELEEQLELCCNYFHVEDAFDRELKLLEDNLLKRLSK